MVYYQDKEAMPSLPNLEILQLLAQSLNTAVLITDAQIESPGPFIIFANQAFAEMSGYSVTDVIGQSPRFLQKGVKRTRQFEEVGRTLRHGRRYYGVLKNMRANGEEYFCEVDIRPLRDGTGKVGGYIAFEREAVHRKGRPAAQGQGRFQPLFPETVGELPDTFHPQQFKIDERSKTP